MNILPPPKQQDPSFILIPATIINGQPWITRLASIIWSVRVRSECAAPIYQRAPHHASSFPGCSLGGQVKQCFHAIERTRHEGQPRRGSTSTPVESADAGVNVSGRCRFGKAHLSSPSRPEINKSQTRPESNEASKLEQAWIPVALDIYLIGAKIKQPNPVSKSFNHTQTRKPKRP